MEFRLFKTYEQELFAVSTERFGGVGKDCYASLNLCDYTGDAFENVVENRLLFCERNEILPNRLFFPRQVHGDTVLRIDSSFLKLDCETQASLLQDVDALITDIKEVCIGVSTADCVPILLYCPHRNVIAVAHAGWRGTASRIAAQTVQILEESYGCCAEDILAVIAPSISMKNYEVGDELYQLFGEIGFPTEQIFTKNQITNKWHLDLWQANFWLLTQAGLRSKNIEVSGICTFEQSERFFSARKLGIESGRMASCMMLKKQKIVKKNKPIIIVDKYIPFVKNVLESVADVRYLEAAEMTNETVRDAEALIIRTRTRCDKSLLEHSNVRFIATATIGFDHIDQDYCREKGIVWTNAPGCNASSVAQYIGSALSFWANNRGVDLSTKTIGIVGVGAVGSEVEKISKLLGLQALKNDPPLEKEGLDKTFVSLQELQSKADIITFHTPLTFEGEFPTSYLAEETFFSNLKNKPLIINTARGGIIKEKALKKAYEKGLISDFIIDCWENEPCIDLDLLRSAFISTPHIAGYSVDGKANATEMSIHAISRFFDFGLEKFKTELSPKQVINTFNLQEKLIENYPIQRDSEFLKESPETFEKQRSCYPVRRELLIDSSEP